MYPSLGASLTCETRRRNSQLQSIVRELRSSGRRLVRQGRLARLVLFVPALFSGNVIDDLAEAQALEPPRGPRRHVSAEVVAVDDDRPLPIESRGRCLGQLLDGDVDCARKVVVRVLLTAEDVNQLRPLLQQLPDLVGTEDLSRHVSPEPRRQLARSAAARPP